MFCIYGGFLLESTCNDRISTEGESDTPLSRKYAAVSGALYRAYSNKFIYGAVLKMFSGEVSEVEFSVTAIVSTYCHTDGRLKNSMGEPNREVLKLIFVF